MTTYHIAGRGGGKTHQMLMRLGEMRDPSTALVVCAHDGEARRIEGEFRHMYPEKKMPRFTTPQKARRDAQGRHGPVFVDDAHYLIEQAIGMRFDHANLNGEA